MAKMTRADFTYLKEKIWADKDYHEKNFLEKIQPDVINSYFEGDPENEYLHDKQRQIGRMTLNKIFPATSTLLVQLLPANPKYLCTPRGSIELIPNEQLELDCKITAGGMNYYTEQMNTLFENQYAILSAWLYGYGVTKQGWRTKFKKPDKATVNGSEQSVYGKIKGFFTQSNAEEDETPEYIDEEGPFLNYVSSKDIYLDKSKPFGKGLYFTQRLVRCLYDIRESGLYNLDDDFYNRFKRGKDEREVELTLYEQWHYMKDGLYVFVMCDGYDKPLRYDKSPYAGEGFPYKVLNFVTEPDVLYPVSHMKVAQRQQRLTDYILTLQKEYIEKHKDLTIFDTDAFAPDDKIKIQKNEIGTNIFTKNGKGPMGAAYSVQGNAIPKDLFNIQGLLSQNISEILTVTGARVGSAEMETATQEKIADYGNQLRSMGLQDKVKDFLLAQGKKLLQDMRQFATKPAIFKVSGLNLKDAQGQMITEDWVEVGTERSPRTLREIIPKDLTVELDVTEFARRDLAVIRKQTQEIMAIIMNPVIQQALAAEGKRFKVGTFIEDALKNYETISNVDKYFDELPPPPVMGPLPPAGMQGPAGPPAGGLTPEAIIQGANQPLNNIQGPQI